MKYLDKNMINSLQNMSTVRKKTDHWTLFYTLLQTGMRISEVCNFYQKDINQGELSIFVRGKGNKIRIVDISRDYLDYMNVYLKEKKIKINERIFPHSRQEYHRIVKTYNENIYPHMFRHTYAISLLRKTKNLRYVQRQLGHSKLDTTAKYLQFVEYEEEKSKLGDLYG